ncbi:ABC transporter permease [Demequina sp.]|uniref:ABC transporter permease n=1 Tax=Demequina sp. TaxID=2050685 RepID=UPI003D0FC250
MTDTLTPPKAGRGTWRVTWSGITLIAALELRQRVRSTRWKWALGVFAGIVALVTFLTAGAVASFAFGESYDIPFGIIVYFVLGLGLVVSPTLSATTINGDNREGTLAPVQATAMSAIDISLGKLLGAWCASLAFLAVALPFIVFAYVQSDMPFGAVLVTVIVLALELLAVCGIGLGWSAITVRTAASAVLTYVSVAALTVISLIVFGLLMPVVSQQSTVRVYAPTSYESDGSPTECTVTEQTYEQLHTEQVWWLLAMNPFVIVADAAPSKDDNVVGNTGGQTMLGTIKYGVRSARLGPSGFENQCWDPATGGTVSHPEDQERYDQLSAMPPVWPWGLAFHALLAGGGVWLAVRRLGVPHGKLAASTRIA